MSRKYELGDLFEHKNVSARKGVEIIFVESPFFLQVIESVHELFESQVHLRDLVIRSNRKEEKSN
jgi:hypothetical protein